MVDNRDTLEYFLRQVNHLKRLNIYPIRHPLEQRIHDMKVDNHHIPINRVLLLQRLIPGEEQQQKVSNPL